MKHFKLLAALMAALVALTACSALAETITIGVPNDTTNEARALQLLASNGIIEIAEGAGETATKGDVISDNVEIVEAEAAMLPNLLPDLDYAVMNLNFVLQAIDAGIEISEPLLQEDPESYMPRANVLAVHSDNVDADMTKALVAALHSQQVKDYIEKTYVGAVVSVVDTPTDGYDPDVDYDALAGQTVVIAATPMPHAEILNNVVTGILAEKDITLKVEEYTDYTSENRLVDAGDAYANYFQHQPYLDQEVSENGYKVESVALIHTEPMGLYGARQSDLSALQN